MNRLVVFIDLDGVLVDFMPAALRASGYGRFFERRPDIRGEDAWRVDELLPGCSKQEFWSRLDSAEFWRDLEILPHAHQIVEAARAVGRTVFLTSPNHNTGCCEGKLQWIRHHFPELQDSFVLTRQKELLAGPGRYLIEDHDPYLARFREHGGDGFLVPALWNSRWREAEQNSNWFVELARDLFLFSENLECFS